MVLQRIVGLGAVSLTVVGLLAIDLGVAIAIEHFMVPYAHSLPVPIVLRVSPPIPYFPFQRTVHTNRYHPLLFPIGWVSFPHSSNSS